VRLRQRLGKFTHTQNELRAERYVLSGGILFVSKIGFYLFENSFHLVTSRSL
jgi:hypothetical protein